LRIQNKTLANSQRKKTSRRALLNFYFHQTRNPFFIPTQTIRSSFQKSVVGARSSVILDSDIIEDKKVYFSTNSRVSFLDFFFFGTQANKKQTNKQTNKKNKTKNKQTNKQTNKQKTNKKKPNKQTKQQQHQTTKNNNKKQLDFVAILTILNKIN